MSVDAAQAFYEIFRAEILERVCELAPPAAQFVHAIHGEQPFGVAGRSVAVAARDSAGTSCGDAAICSGCTRSFFPSENSMKLYSHRPPPFAKLLTPFVRLGTSDKTIILAKTNFKKAPSQSSLGRSRVFDGTRTLTPADSAHSGTTAGKISIESSVVLHAS
jgi:hypothetical protein